MLRPPLYGQYIPVSAANFLTPALLVIKLGLGVLLFVVAYYGFKRRKTEGWLAFVAMLLAAIANYQHELRLVNVKISTTVFDFNVSLGTVSTILSILIITAMLLIRFVYSERLKEQWRLEIQQARDIQQILIPAAIPEIKGLTIDPIVPGFEERYLSVSHFPESWYSQFHQLDMAVEVVSSSRAATQAYFKHFLSHW